MEMTPVNSSHMRAVGYDEPTRTMHIEFQNGDLHEYKQVSPDFHKRMMQSKSVGSFFHQNVKPFFNSRRVK